MSNFPVSPISLGDITVKPIQAAGQKRKLLKYIKPGVFALQIDNSSLEVFTTCPRAAEYKLLRAREGGGSAALIYGGAVHNGLEAWYRGGMDTQDESLWNTMVLDAMKKFEGFTPGLTEWRTPDRCVDTLSRYIAKYPTEPFSVHKVNGEPSVEIPFSLPLGVITLSGENTQYTFKEIVDPETYDTGMNDDVLVSIDELHVYWTGKIDVVIELDGQLWVMDHKTSSIGGPQYFKEFELSQQTIGYCWAGQEIFGVPFKGLLANVIIGRKPTKTGIPTDFMRQRYYYRKDQIEEWRQDVLTLCADFAANLERSYFPRHTKWCVAKYGVCKYHDVCSLPPEMRMSHLHSDLFTDVTWSPLND